MSHIRQQIREAFVLGGAIEGADEIIQDDTAIRVQTPSEEIEIEPNLGSSYGSRTMTRLITVTVSILSQGATMGAVLDSLDSQAVTYEKALPGTILTIVDSFELVSTETELSQDDTEQHAGVLTMNFIATVRTAEDAPEIGV